MFRNNKNNKSSKKTYESFDSWSNKNKREVNSRETTKEFKTPSQRTSEEKDSSKKPNIWRKISGTKDYKESFPKPEKSEKTPTKNSQKQTSPNSRGSIAGSGAMGVEGSAGSNYTGVNPDLRRRLKEKKEKEAQAARDLAKANKELSKRDEKIAAEKKALRKKHQLRQAVIMAEIIGPPKAKKFS